MVGFSPQIIPLKNRVFHYFHHPFWGTTILGNPHVTFPKDPISSGWSNVWLNLYKPHVTSVSRDEIPESKDDI